MAAIVEDIRIKNVALGDTASTDWLFDNIGDVINVEIDFRVEDYLVVNSITRGDGDRYVYAWPTSLVTGLLDDKSLLWFEQDGIIEDWNIGDTIIINGSDYSDGTKTITEIVNGNTIRLTPEFTVREELKIGSIVANNTSIEGIEFSHNLIENDESPNFISKVDGSERKARVTGLSSLDTVTEHDMDQLGNKSYQYGYIKAKGNGKGLAESTTVSQGFTISQALIVDPLFLSDQIEDIRNGIAPPYFKDGKCLKYVFNIEASKDVTNPNKKKEGVSGEVRGNSGWFNESYNTKKTNYSISDIVYKKGTTANQSLELTTDETQVEFIINNTIDTPFSNGNTKFVMNFALLPQPETQYRDELSVTKQELKTNYILDRTEGVLGSTTTTPDNLGTDIQVFKEVDFLYVSTSQMKVIATIDMPEEVVARVANLSSMDYVLFISTQDHTKNNRGNNSDKVALTADVGLMFIDTTDPTMIDIDLSFLTHPYSNIETETTTDLNAHKLDDLLGLAKFTLDQNGREDDDIYITSVINQIIIKKGSQEYELDGDNTSLVGTKRVNGITFIDNLSDDRGFKTPVDENRANIKLSSKTALDAAGIFNYESGFPFIFRWETWEPNDNIPDAFHDATKDNNGLNHNWNRYDNNPDWDIFFKVTVNATKNGSPQTYSEYLQIRSNDYTEGPEWDTENIQSFEVASGDNLSGLIQGYADSRIEGNKTYIGTTLPSLSDLVIVLLINVYRSGNVKEVYTTSSAYDNHAATFWLSTNGTNRLEIITSGSPVFKGQALLNADLLDPDIEDWKITCRFYDKRADVPFPLAGAKQMQDDSFKQKTNDAFKRRS